MRVGVDVRFLLEKIYGVDVVSGSRRDGGDVVSGRTKFTKKSCQCVYGFDKNYVALPYTDTPPSGLGVHTPLRQHKAVNVVL